MNAHRANLMRLALALLAAGLVALWWMLQPSATPPEPTRAFTSPLEDRPVPDQQASRERSEPGTELSRVPPDPQAMSPSPTEEALVAFAAAAGASVVQCTLPPDTVFDPDPPDVIVEGRRLTLMVDEPAGHLAQSPYVNGDHPELEQSGGTVVRWEGARPGRITPCRVLEPSRWVDLHVRVEDPDGAPIGRAPVSVGPNSGVTMGDGTITLPAYEGWWMVQATSPLGMPVVAVGSIEVEFVDGAQVTVVLDPDAEPEHVDGADDLIVDLDDEAGLLEQALAGSGLSDAGREVLATWAAQRRSMADEVDDLALEKEEIEADIALSEVDDAERDRP